MKRLLTKYREIFPPLVVVRTQHAQALAYGWPSYSQLIIFTSSKNIFTSSKNIFTGSRNKTLAKATHN